MVIIGNNLQNKLTQAIKYLSQKVDDYQPYTELIDELQLIQKDISDAQIKVTIVSRKQKLIDLVENLSIKGDRKNYSITTTALPTPINKLIQNYDLILLILDSTQPITSQEDQLIKKVIQAQIILAIIIKQAPIKQAHDFKLEQKYQIEIPTLNLLINNQEHQYNSFFAALLAQSISCRELKFKQQTVKVINQYFEQSKKATWQQIQQGKDLYLSGKNPEQIQQIINQLPHRCNRLTQNYLRIVKQNNNQNKLNLVNPFFSDSLMYQVQNAIQDARVISQQEKQKTYLRLVLENENYTQAIHTYVIDACQNLLETWLIEEWSKIETKYNDGGLNKLQQQLTLELQPLASLCQDIKILQPEIKPQLQLANYICLSALADNSKIPFDYHYAQSTWFRLLVAVTIGTIIFVLTERLFGFVLLFVQIVNLLTGQDAKSLRLRQQTKEIKRIIEGKYQFLVRFITDRMTQDIAIALDNINQQYQEQIDSIVQNATKQLHIIKQDINLNKAKIEELQKVQLKIQNIFQQ